VVYGCVGGANPKSGDGVFYSQRERARARTLVAHVLGLFMVDGFSSNPVALKLLN
jgi:hypothetical protein